MKAIYITLLMVLIGGCSGVKVYDTSDAQRQGIYATNKAIKSKRYDLAEQYSDQTLRLTPPPAKQIVISTTPFPDDSKNFSQYTESVDKQLRKQADDNATLAADLKAEQEKTASLEKYRLIVFSVLGLIGLCLIGWLIVKFKWIGL